ncbi:sigma-70 family RNA polymerase sigma factor [Maribacter sp. PR1]|uniref:Sigma-70 family RNA polymerase sigma factor n=1 Tax=Maribacter cobaltidurans TaxID=1178778 RepID=A0ABU7ISP7_9FLAO|nr:MULTISPECIES: sigma-70 family RNA polymerase sigma factor [Maribacter]MDC6388511.1 sigma-70 family RNA polymerase sigma factor [Maribacter sp. PR1]MEE1975900.1 sigma-70 family RNA polymerase sigma factor [Maribacter cobaltidurans]
MGNAKDFADVIRKHQGLIYKVTSIYTNNEQDREDLFQEIVYQLWKYFDTFRNEAKISTWMYRVAMNTAITHLKKSKRSPSSVPLPEYLLSASDTKDEVFEERLKSLYLHIKQLNTLEKGLMLLLLEGKSYKEIASITGLNPSNVGTRISRIKQKLKQNMTNS